MRLSALLGALTAAGCSGPEQPATGRIQELHGAAKRAEPSGELPNAASDDGWSFGWRLFAEARKGGDANDLFSPYSVSLLAAMLVSGAEGQTKSEIEAALSFSVDDDPIFHQARNSVAHALGARNHPKSDGTTAQILRVSNDLWLDPEFRPGPHFLDTLSAYYGAAVFLAPFHASAETARNAINEKVANDTAKLIEELLPPGSVDGASLVLTNALYLKANWATRFSESATTSGVFVDAAGESQNVPLMRLSLEARYFRGPNYEALALPYASGEVEFVAIMPDAGTFQAFTETLTADAVAAATSKLRNAPLDLRFPKFEIKSRTHLKEWLMALGMRRAFDSASAEFHRLGPDQQVFISNVFHDATVKVNEGGTEAAAATAAVVSVDISPPAAPTGFVVTFDHPFVFFIRDIQTNALLFVGQLASPVDASR